MGFRNPPTPGSIGAIAVSQRGVPGGVATLDPTEAVHTADQLLQAKACRLYNSVNQTLDVSGTAEILSWDTEVFDQGGFHDAGTPTRLTIPRAGKYIIIAQAQFVSNATGRRDLEILVDGTLRGSANALAVTAIQTRVQVSAVLNLIVGNYVEIRANQTSGGALDVSGTANSTNVSIGYLGS